MYSFGNNKCGQLGIQNNMDQTTPIEVSFFNDKEILVKDSFQNMGEIMKKDENEKKKI